MSLIQNRFWSWSTDSIEAASLGGSVGRAQPAWDGPGRLPPIRRVVIGAKLYLEVESASTTETDSLWVRADLGGGQVYAENPDARVLLVVQSRGLDAAGAAQPVLVSPDTATVSPRESQWSSSHTWDSITAQIWPGCSACLPIYCEDTVRLLVRPTSPFAWSVRATLTLWIESD